MVAYGSLMAVDEIEPFGTTARFGRSADEFWPKSMTSIKLSLQLKKRFQSNKPLPAEESATTGHRVAGENASATAPASPGQSNFLGAQAEHAHPLWLRCGWYRLLAPGATDDAEYCAA